MRRFWRGMEPVEKATAGIATLGLAFIVAILVRDSLPKDQTRPYPGLKVETRSFQTAMGKAFLPQACSLDEVGNVTGSRFSGRLTFVDAPPNKDTLPRRGLGILGPVVYEGHGARAFVFWEGREDYGDSAVPKAAKYWIWCRPAHGEAVNLEIEAPGDWQGLPELLMALNHRAER